jgi:hypothetical protein
MNQEIKKRWVSALKSGDYKQGKSELRPTVDSFCCLGVLCDLYLNDTKNEWNSTSSSYHPYGIYDEYTDSYEYEILPIELEKRSPDVENKDLIVLNDSGYNFNDIADLIEKHL